jgi:MarR family
VPASPRLKALNASSPGGLPRVILRPYDLGTTQWYVLYQLANDGPTRQRDLVRMLQIERATLSVIVTTLVRKGLVDQMPDAEDQRQRVLRRPRPCSRDRAPLGCGLAVGGRRLAGAVAR